MTLRAALALLVLAGCAAPDAARSGTFKVGAARVDITPREPVRLSGYAARKKPSEGVEQPIHARAIAFEDAAGSRAVVVAIDAIGLTGEIREAALAKVPGLAPERFTVCSTHSHTAPFLNGVAWNLFELTPEEQAATDRYTALVVDRIAEAANAALRDLAPAGLSVGWTHAGFAANRRTPGGPVDPEVPVLRAVGPDGKLRALLFGYACHCTTLGPEFNRVFGDWAGVAAQELERDGAVALCVIGGGADANPSPRTGLELSKRHGRALASAVRDLLGRDAFRPVGGPIEGRLARLDLPFEAPPTPEALRQTLEKGAPQDKRLAKRLLEAGAPASLPYPVQTLRFGDSLAFVFLGGELVVDYALRIKREHDPSRIWTVGYANDVPCYIPSERVLAEGGYEGGGAMVWFGRPAKFARGVEERILSQVRAFVPEGFRRPRPAAVKSPVGPEESLKLFHLEPGFEIDLAACEPKVFDPIHIAWDARGRMYVTEMIDYPEGPPSGRIVLFDGAKWTVFAKLPYPTSAMAWRNGILATSDPDLLYLEDTDGDGAADVRKVLFTGFAGGNTQHRVNNLQWGIDNWIYGGNGDSRATITSPAHPARPPVTMSFADFRFRPDTGEFETLAEHSGYAMTFDDAGNRFVSGSGGNMRHAVLDRALRDRSPLAPGITNAQALEARSKLHPVSGQVERFNDPLDEGHFTSASGLHVYRGGLFPEAYRGNAFFGESMGNLVHRDALVRQGSSFKAAPHTQPAEFLASRDPWFRPVFATTGPDGCLYIADMYRAVIEHPEWIPEDIEKAIDLRAGEDKGRIYRVRHRAAPAAAVERLDLLSGAELAARLESPNGWVRDTAQRLLFERQEKAGVDRLKKIAAEAPLAASRLQALWTLDGLGVRTGTGLSDADPRVRETAVRLVEAKDVLPLAKDPDMAVRRRAASRLGELDSQEAVDALAALILDSASDAFVRATAVLCRPDVAHRLLPRVTGQLPFVWRLAQVVGKRNDAAQVRETLAFLLPKPGEPMAEWQMVAFGGGIVEAMGRRVRSLADPERLAHAIGEAARMADDPKVVDGTRYDALLVLGIGDGDRPGEILRKYLSPKFSPELQGGAILGLSYLAGGADVAGTLLVHWGSYAPAQREAVLDAIFRRPDRIGTLLEAVEKKKVALQELGNGRKEQLRRLSDEALRKRAAVLLDTDTRADRQRVYEARKPALGLKGRRPEGLALFKKHCAECHPVQGVGPGVGPDLVTVRKRDRAVLLLDLLDPNVSVAPNYVAYNVATRDEIIYSGLVVSQSPAAVTIRLKGGVERTIPRDQVEEIKSTGKSLMPEMFETVMTDQELADLIEYMRQIQ